MAAIVPSSFRGTVRLNTGPGSTSTANSIVATCNITASALSKPHDGTADVNYTFKSDGAVNINWDESTTTGLTELSGWGGSVSLPSGLNADIEAWSGTINVGDVEYGTFTSQWRKSKLTTANLTGNASGKLRIGAANTKPLPTS